MLQTRRRNFTRQLVKKTNQKLAETTSNHPWINTQRLAPHLRHEESRYISLCQVDPITLPFQRHREKNGDACHEPWTDPSFSRVKLFRPPAVQQWFYEPPAKQTNCLRVETPSVSRLLERICLDKDYSSKCIGSRTCISEGIVNLCYNGLLLLAITFSLVLILRNEVISLHAR